MTDYVLGFAFTGNLSRVLLARKNRSPKNLGDKMLNRLNGIGGHLEELDLLASAKSHLGIWQSAALIAMNREAKEEADLNLNWTSYCTLNTNSAARVFCFYAVDDAVLNFKQMEDEKLDLYNANDDPEWSVSTRGCYREYDRMPNLDWLIPMALNHAQKLDSAAAFTVQEH